MGSWPMEAGASWPGAGENPVRSRCRAHAGEIVSPAVGVRFLPGHPAAARDDRRRPRADADRRARNSRGLARPDAPPRYPYYLPDYRTTGLRRLHCRPLHLRDLEGASSVPRTDIRQDRLTAVVAMSQYAHYGSPARRSGTSAAPSAGDIPCVSLAWLRPPRKPRPATADLRR